MTGTRRRVLIIGGYGFFGSRLVRLLADEPRLDILVAGRSRAKAQAYCASLDAANLHPVRFDRGTDVAAQLAALAPDLVVDAAGPFQLYGQSNGVQPHAVAEAVLAYGAHYLDIADGRAFVTGFGTLDEAARGAGCFALAGASTHPALACAVVRALGNGLAAVDAIATGIVPSRRAGVGLSVVRAIASYAGRPVMLRRGGERCRAYAQIDAKRRGISVPGMPPVADARFTLLDVPDLDLMPAAWPTIGDVWCGVSPTPALAHRLLTAFAWAVRWRLLRSLTPLAWIMHLVPRIFCWGETRGAMFVAVRGYHANGDATERVWSLIAPGATGPDVPLMGCAALIGKWLDGDAPAAGARPAHNDLELGDYQPFFEHHGIRTATTESYIGQVPLLRHTSSSGGSPLKATRVGPALYETVLGPRYGGLAAAVANFHRTGWQRRARGRASVARGRSMAARVVGRLMAFPAATDDTPVHVVISRDGTRERWQRAFGDDVFASVHEAGTGVEAGLIVERFAKLAFALKVGVDNGRLTLHLVRWRLWRLTLPRVLAPRINATEHDAGGRFHFDVRIELPLVGLIVHYRGWLAPEDAVPLFDTTN